MVTYQCNVACRHCGPYCAPEEKDWISVDEIKKLIVEADRLGAQNVVFTGGEPTLLKEKLLELFKFIKSETCIGLTRMVTNGKFASTYEIAYEKLREWKDAGLDEINISCGEFHQEWIPIEYIANAYKAACDLDYMTVMLAGEFLNEKFGKISPQDFDKAVGKKLNIADTRSPFSTKFRGLQCGAVMPYGRGKKYITDEQTVLLNEKDISSLCSDVNSVITIHPNGNVTSCCGVMVREDSLLTIGNWRNNSLEVILDEASQDIILNWIKHVGLHDMKEWLKKKDSTLKFRDKYSSICDLCAEIMYNKKCQKILVENAQEKAGEVLINKLAHEATVFSPNYNYV